MGNLKEVRSPKGELLYYVEVEENETKKRRSKAKARSKPKSNSEFPYVDMPPKTVKGKGGKLIYPKWLYDVQRRAYSEARSAGIPSTNTGLTSVTSFKWPGPSGYGLL